MGIIERKEREKEARRSAILDAAESVFKEKSFAMATMEDVARQAELAKGTVYLYYKSKEELLLGLVMRALDLMADAFAEGMAPFETSFEKLLSMGDAYWKFAKAYPFYFSTMHMMEMPDRGRPEQIGEEVVHSLDYKSNCVWRDMIVLIDESKAEGMIREEVESFAFSMLLWMNTTSSLRFANKVKAMSENAWQQKEGFNPCNMDLRAMYVLNANLLFQQIVTETGRTKLEPIVWPKNTPRPAIPEEPMHRFEPFAEELPAAFLENTSL
jgi:TetR/AcrR family transcriptional regulator